MHYRQRLQQTLSYIGSHLQDELTVDSLSRQANLSKYHFHRLFSLTFGITPADYIRLQRLKRASYQLAYRSEIRILDIALENGYQSAEAFSRAFKTSFGQSPSSFRKLPQWQPWFDKYRALTLLREQIMKQKPGEIAVNTVFFAKRQVAVLEHRGAPELLGHSIAKFISWRKANNLPPKVSETFNLVYDDPHACEGQDFRFDLCAGVTGEVEENAAGVKLKEIPEGRCAVFRHIGPDENLRAGIEYLYGPWLEQSGEQLRDFPLFFQRVSFFPEVAEQEMITDVFLPLR
ncbi:AraC family transcriptional regulator [Thalassomonas actiniarum]|uniref:AraC family transcriptional regulator n=1 Tax=Thalassomonas actiniarum TaxID=485447 RepID=A0AAE9YM24_9GAMM|nr:AraC family transcriptional regulator [Thalassomonas actiniarum]WDD97471.1 AraC family transcriptional regulator [Thalassomonas actiniarum]